MKQADTGAKGVNGERAIGAERSTPVTQFETEEEQKLCLVRDKFRP